MGAFAVSVVGCKVKAIEKVYRILGERAFNKFEAEFYFKRDYPSCLEWLCDITGFFAIESAFFWLDTKDGHWYWKQKSMKLRKEWSKYDD